VLSPAGEEEMHMSYNAEQELTNVSTEQLEPSPPVEPTDSAAVRNGTQVEPALDGANANRYAEAGRKGAQRIHQLIQEGKLYEQEHGLKSGRQRIRQLIEQGKLYEKEHGLRLGSRKHARERLPRVSSEQIILDFCQSLLRLVKPQYRGQVVRMIDALRSDDHERELVNGGLTEELHSHPESAA